MRLKTLLSACVSALLCFLLCGCSLFATDTAELLSPPALSGDLAPIADAISKSVGGDYTLKYPSGGNFRSAVVQNDIDGDGLFEAFAFYSTGDGSSDAAATMHINIICSRDGEWVSAAEQSIVAGGVDRIDFCDLDGDGIQEILVGWEIYSTSKMQLAVYSFRDNKITQRMLQEYSCFVCCDLDEDGANEIFIINHTPAEQKNSASVYQLTDTGVTELYSCELDHTVQSVSVPVVSYLSSGRPAVYIDEVKGVGAVTEVLFVERNRLVNPLLNTESRENLSTIRSVGLTVSDINNDGVIEIPIQENVPSITKSDVNEKIYLTNWCSYNGETLTGQMMTMIDRENGYYYIISQKWLGQIAILKDNNSGSREIYQYNSETMTAGERLITFTAVKKSDWDSGKYSDENYEEITNDGITAYLCKISEAGEAEGITLDTVKQNFRLIE